MDFLPNLVQHDEQIHSDELQRDPGNGTLATWDEWTGPETIQLTHWTTALRRRGTALTAVAWLVI